MKWDFHIFVSTSNLKRKSGSLNLLPIPMLDGGHLVYYVYEIIFGEELPYKVQLAAQFIGIALLGFIMIIAFYNDFVRIFS